MTANGVLLAISAALAISLTNVLSRAHFDTGSTPETFLVGRYLIVVVVLSVVLGGTGRLSPPSSRQSVELSIAGGLGMIGGACLAFAIERMAVGLAVAILYLFPLFTLLMGSVADRRWPRIVTVAGAGIAFCGLVIALDVTGEPPNPAGIALAIAAAVAMAGSFVCIERRLGDLSEPNRVHGLAAVGLACALGLGFASGNVVWPLPRPDGWSTLLGATAAFGIASVAMFLAVPRIGATSTAMIMNLEPPATVVLAAVLIGDRIGAWQVLGIGIVVAAVTTTQWLSIPSRTAVSP